MGLELDQVGTVEGQGNELHSRIILDTFRG
jgi:hypothetical protein